jgi:mannose-6-phosphate isomerase-like protein (cupin superfamily)
MLRAGDPYNPGPNGAVLEYRDDLSLATLEPRFETAVHSSPMIYFFYVQAGDGTIDSGAGTESFKVRNGTGILVGPNVKQRFVNTGDTQLSMIMLSWLNNDGMKAPDRILTVDTFARPFGPNRAHWVHMAKAMFNNADGINTTMSAIYFPPMSYGGPHAHVQGVEEIWVKVGDDEGYAILGSEIRRMTGTGAFLSPPNGKTYHSSMNLSTDKPSVWLYISRRAPGRTQGQAPPPVQKP